MLRATIDDVAAATGGRVLLGPGDRAIHGLVIDSREVRAGGAFLALPGETTDGHGHLASAIDAGAHALVITRTLEDSPELVERATRRGVAVLRVEDALRALADIATLHRSRLDCRVVGITGSTGKTTTKDLISAVLGTTFRTVSTSGNRNNEIGLPLTVLSAGSDTEVLVVEMGMRGTGQIARLCEIARPTHGLVTNVGTSHIELLGAREAIADAKGELVRAIPADGAVFLNGDDDFSSRLAALSAAPVGFYGLGSECSPRAEDVVLDDMSLPAFMLEWRGASAAVKLGVPGRHNVYNALAASAIALELGVSLEDVAVGLGAAWVSEMRMESFVTATGLTVINDAYNASPSSMAAAVDMLSALKVAGRRIAVLGDMAELGSLEELAHFKLGEQVADSGIALLVTVGERAARIRDGARAAGMPAEGGYSCGSVDEALEVLDDLVQPGDAVLVKASRVMRLEAVVEGLVKSSVR